MTEWFILANLFNHTAMKREHPHDYYDRLQREDEGRENNRHRYDTEMNSRDCEHDMEYSGTLGVVGGRCKKCGYSTL